MFDTQQEGAFTFILVHLWNWISSLHTQQERHHVRLELSVLYTYGVKENTDLQVLLFRLVILSAFVEQKPIYMYLVLICCILIHFGIVLFIRRVRHSPPKKGIALKQKSRKVSLQHRSKKLKA